MLNVSKGEGELARARVGRGQGLRLTLDLNSNWVSHGTLPSDKQANTFSNIKYIVVGGGYLSKYLLFVLTTKSGCISGVGWTTGLSLSQSLKFACGPWQRDLGGGAQNQKWHESYKNETFDCCPGRFNVQLWNKLITRAGDSAGGYKPPLTRLSISDLSRMPLASRECPCPPCSLFSLQVQSHNVDFWPPLKTTSMTMLLNHSADIFSSCRLECGLARAESEVHCVPWALPRGPGVKVFVFLVPLPWWSLIPF